MKKTLLFITLLLVFSLNLSAQFNYTSKDKANAIVWQHMINETEEFIVYAKNSVQPTGTITTSSGEVIKFDYSCWIYYVNYPLTNNSKYLIVKEAKWNLLEINAKNDEGPSNLQDWKVIPIKICDVGNPLTDLPWMEEVIKSLQNVTNSTHYIDIRICTYKDGLGFLISPCMFFNNGMPYELRNCEGKKLCTRCGYTDTCEWFDIDNENTVIIWSKKPLY